MTAAAKEVDVSDAASISLLRRVRGGEELHFVHRVDVCSAVPEVLAADLEPVPGTGLADGVWYFLCAKKFKNNQGKASGHKHRRVSGGDGTWWRPERRPQDVEGSAGGTVCNFSYGRNLEGPGTKFVRMGWCMREYDDKQDDDDDAAGSSTGNYVMCKVYRSSYAKGKSSSSSSSSSGEKKASSKKAKRKAGGDHPEAPPTKLIQEQQAQQQQETAHYYPAMPCYDNVNAGMFGEERQELAVQQPGGPESEYGGDINDLDGFNFNTDFLQVLRAETGQSLQQPEQGQGQGSEHIQIPWGGPVVPVVDQATLGRRQCTATA